LGDYENMTRSMAANIYCGMMTDTGGFTYNSNQPEIYTIISMLLAKGIDKDKIYRNIYHVFSIDRLRLTGYVLYQKLRMLTPLRASYYTLSKEEQRRFHFIKGDAEGLVNMPLQLRNHRLSISLREDSEKPNVIWVSLRSVDDFPCNEMSQRFFNGCGHKNASGGKLFCSLQEAEKIVRDAIQSYASLL
jgi:phosphoesterase RecJ-like protein